jgi:hypothetical protein
MPVYTTEGDGDEFVGGFGKIGIADLIKTIRRHPQTNANSFLTCVLSHFEGLLK